MAATDSDTETKSVGRLKKFAYLIELVVGGPILSLQLLLWHFVCSFFRRLFWNRQVSLDESRFVLISGCDSIVSQSIAKTLYNSGVHVLAGCATEDGRRALRNACGGNGKGKLTDFLLDTTSDDAVEKAKNFLKPLIPADKGLWAIINNVGISDPKLMADVADANEYRKALVSNFYAQIRVAHAFMQQLKQVNGTRMIFVMNDFEDSDEKGPCRAANEALKGYTESLRAELYDFDVRVILLRVQWQPEAEVYKMDINESYEISKMSSHFAHAVLAKYPETVYIRKQLLAERKRSLVKRSLRKDD